MTPFYQTPARWALRRRLLPLCLLLAAVLLPVPRRAHAAEPEPDPAQEQAALGRSGAAAVVLYNSAMPESLSIARHYASRRGVPESQIIGFALPTSESMSREDFDTRLVKPLVAELLSRDLWKLRDEIQPAEENRPGRIVQVPIETRIRALVVCYGVPVRIAEDPTRVERETAQFAAGLRRNEAAVDAELTALPFLLSGKPITGPLVNPWLGVNNGLALGPLGGVFVVGRLDGPTPDLAKRLVDLALEAEKNGLLGRGYFDIRGLTNTSYVTGDRWISNAWAAATSYGYETHLDRAPAVLPTGFPLSHLALYAGWYEGRITGAMADNDAEFMPGAIAYHLHSFSAAKVRTSTEHWVGPLIAQGATATLGTVAEPYLDGTPDIGLCFARLLFHGLTWGEAAIASQKYLSWQLTVLGDPLYRPFAVNALARAKDLATRGLGPRADWASVTLYNRRRLASGDLQEAIRDLEKEPRLRFSAVLQEKLAEFHEEAGSPAEAAKRFLAAVPWQATPMQKRRLLWHAGRNFLAADQKRDAYSAWKRLASETHPTEDPAAFFERLAALARSLGEEREARRWSEELARLRPPVPDPKP